MPVEFTSELGRVEDLMYVGRFAAGGFGDQLDLQGRWFTGYQV